MNTELMRSKVTQVLVRTIKQLNQYASSLNDVDMIRRLEGKNAEQLLDGLTKRAIGHIAGKEKPAKEKPDADQET